MNSDRKILVGMIAGAHGVKGDVRLKSFTEEPADIAKYQPLTDQSGGREFAVKLKAATNNYFIASVAGVKGRDEAEALRGTRLYAARAALPKLRKREYYEADLIGLAAVDAQGRDAGK
ncbi:MAG TPA: ribosome maturation factor RimM, partial [Alphaproteobacteria bacterium]|nr:ribosome maturation factor RimM [Alphaproteobacteria bacterium]